VQSLPMRTLPLAQRSSGRSVGGRAIKPAGSTGIDSRVASRPTAGRRPAAAHAFQCGRWREMFVVLGATTGQRHARGLGAGSEPSLVVSRDVCNVKTTGRGAIATARHERADLQRRYCIIFPAVRPILRHG